MKTSETPVVDPACVPTTFVDCAAGLTCRNGVLQIALCETVALDFVDQSATERRVVARHAMRTEEARALAQQILAAIDGRPFLSTAPAEYGQRLAS